MNSRLIKRFTLMQRSVRKKMLAAAAVSRSSHRMSSVAKSFRRLVGEQLISARRLDFGQLFETIEELDIGEPVLRDIILKSVISLNDRNTLEVLLIDTHEKYTRGVTHVAESPNFENVALQDSSRHLNCLPSI